MGGKGPAPKKKQNRTNRNIPLRGEWVKLPAEPYSGPKPPLPRVSGGLLASTKKTWAIWWSTPMAHKWTEADWPVLQTLIVMTDQVTRALSSGQAPTGAMLSESRRLRDQLGLSEPGRRSLRWELPGEDEEDEGGPGVASVTNITSHRKRPDPRL